MDPASAAPVAGSAGIPAAPRTPASSPPSAGRSRTDVPPPADSSPPHTPLAAPARTVPRLSSLRPLPILAEDLLLPDFCSGPAARLSGRFIEGFFHRRSHSSDDPRDYWRGRGHEHSRSPARLGDRSQRYEARRANAGDESWRRGSRRPRRLLGHATLTWRHGNGRKHRP